jgi:hypothetical protein
MAIAAAIVAIPPQTSMYLKKIIGSSPWKGLRC